MLVARLIFAAMLALASAGTNAQTDPARPRHAEIKAQLADQGTEVRADTPESLG